MLMTGVTAKQVTDQFRDGALFRQNESRVWPVQSGPLAGEDQEVSPVKGDEHTLLRCSIVQLVFVASPKIVGLSCGTAIDSPFA